MLLPIPCAVNRSQCVIRKLRPDLDIAWIHNLWEKSFSSQWSLQKVELKQQIGAATLVLVAEEDDTPVGVCAVSEGGDPAGLLLIMVEPSWRGRGIGRSLLETAEKMLISAGVQNFNLGFGSTGDYFWPGAPVDQTAFWSFARTAGWEERERSFDLYKDLTSYQTPDWVLTRLATAAITIQLANVADAGRVVAFEQSQFPLWAPFFKESVRTSQFHNILIDRTQGGQIVGSLLLEADEPLLWSKTLGRRCGSLSVLGVAADQQNKGIGIALAAKAMEVIRERGGTGCYIQWTGLVAWYGKLGTETWAEYHMSSKQLV